MRLIPRDTKFFDLFAELSSNLTEGAKLLRSILADPHDLAMRVSQVQAIEHKGDKATYSIIAKLNQTFITPFDREDIHRLASSLDDVLDFVNSAALRFPNTFSLAKDFEVSQKTIKRDIQWMRDHWDLPIAFNRNRRGYHYTKPVDKFPGVPTVTEPEMFALLVAHKAIEQYQSTSFHKPLQMAFQKLTGQLDRHLRYSLQDFDSVLSFRPFAPEILDLERFESVTRALRHHRTLRFQYRKPGEKSASLRTVQPYPLTCHENLWYLIAFDLARSDFRPFAPEILD